MYLLTLLLKMFLGDCMFRLAKLYKIFHRTLSEEINEIIFGTCLFDKMSQDPHTEQANQKTFNVSNVRKIALNEGISKGI